MNDSQTLASIIESNHIDLAILSSFYKYALDRYLLAPMDDQGHVMNPLTIVSREKVEAWQGIHWLEPEEAQAALNKIDRNTCFISYFGKDVALARRMYADLQSNHVRRGFAPKDL